MLRKALSVLLCLLLLCSMGSFTEEEQLPAAPVRSQSVRVLLSRLKLTDQADFTLASPYFAQTENGTRLFLEEGTQIHVSLTNGKLVLYVGGLSVACGEQLELLRQGEGSSETGLRVTNFSPLYNGDLSLRAAEEGIEPVLSLHVEDYLLGVVPYEMSDSFPLEALKAQAVAARTYAISAQGAHESFDLYDTTADQVYRGDSGTNPNCRQAIEETRGVCAFYQGKLANCYYAASNGGYTELVRNVWPQRKDLPYYAESQDPYDVENPASKVQSFEVQRSYKTEAPYALRSLVSHELGESLEKLGFDVSPDALVIRSVRAVSVHTPLRKGSGVMTKLHLEVLISARPKAANSEAVLPLCPLPKWFSLDADIFPTCEEILGLNLSGNYANEIWRVTESESSYTIEVRRFGHGIGMSQRGAQWMALQYGKNYQEILTFYYPGIELMVYPAEETRYTEDTDGLCSTQVPAATPTPKPTLMPLSATPSPEQAFAEVTEIDDDSTLNLRAAPSLNTDIIMRLYKGQKLLVLERCKEDGWVRVCTDSVEGYVMEKFLTIDEGKH